MTAGGFRIALVRVCDERSKREAEAKADAAAFAALVSVVPASSAAASSESGLGHGSLLRGLVASISVPGPHRLCAENARSLAEPLFLLEHDIEGVEIFFIYCFHCVMAGNGSGVYDIAFSVPRPLPTKRSALA